jgi:hypothetical protein
MSARRCFTALALLAVAVAVAVAAFVLRSNPERGDGEADLTSPRGSFVVTWTRTRETYRIRRPCGAVRVRGKSVTVDITEGQFRLTCVAARAVMRRYLARRDNGTVHYDGRTFECWNSRPDSVGWDYNCIYSDEGLTLEYVGVGAGRRPHF